jgi:excisionase family DNA binding protein
MTVHAGQLSLIEPANGSSDERGAQPRRTVRPAVTRPDKAVGKPARPTQRSSRKLASGSTPIGDLTLLTTHETAELLRVHPRTVQRLVRSGELSAVHFGTAVRFDPRDVDGLVVRLKRRVEGATSPLDDPVRARRGVNASFSERLRSRRHEHRAAQA